MFRRSAPHNLSGKARALAATLFGCGLSPHKLSLTLCLGAALGTMPLAWGTTFLCILAAARFGLNQGAMLAVNYLCYPLQLVLFLPFCRAGESLLPWGPAVSGELLKNRLHDGLGGSFDLLAWATARAVCAWVLIALPLALLAYPILKACLSARGRRVSMDANSTGAEGNAHNVGCTG